MATPTIYMIPGLGADARMYTPQLKLWPEAIVLEHNKPLAGETLRDYARRLSERIDTSKPFVLIGTSLGGILAIEISKIIYPDRVILISSVKHRGELPVWMRAMKYLRLHRFLSGERFIKVSNSNIKRLITKRDSAVAKLLTDMHLSADPAFVQWAINEVINWQGDKNYREDIVHIHGTKDRLFPHTRLQDVIPIRGGSHVMVLTQAADVNDALRKVLDKL